MQDAQPLQALETIWSDLLDLMIFGTVMSNVSEVQDCEAFVLAYPPTHCRRDFCNKVEAVPHRCLWGHTS